MPDHPAEPRQAPYTRAISSTEYIDRPWVIGQYGGFGSAGQTNLRLRQLLESGQTGFSVALDLPTQLGLDSDDPRAGGEVDRVGVPIERQNVDPNDVTIFIQNDVLKELVARGTQIFPPAAGLRMAGDVVGYTARHLPVWTPMALSGYHIR